MPVTGPILRRINLARIGDAPVVAVERAEETGLVALMACGAVAMLFDPEQDCVMVALGADLAHALKIARLLAFAPQAVARTREVAGMAAANRFLQGLAVHVGDHQHASAG